jgi:hypothetical protein
VRYHAKAGGFRTAIPRDKRIKSMTASFVQVMNCLSGAAGFQKPGIKSLEIKKAQRPHYY